MFQGLNDTQRAAGHIFSALEHLKEAKSHLLRVKSDQHIHLCINLGALEEIHETLTDPECTPEILEDEHNATRTNTKADFGASSDEMEASHVS